MQSEISSNSDRIPLWAAFRERQKTDSEFISRMTMQCLCPRAGKTGHCRSSCTLVLACSCSFISLHDHLSSPAIPHCTCARSQRPNIRKNSARLSTTLLKNLNKLCRWTTTTKATKHPKQPKKFNSQSSTKSPFTINERPRSENSTTRRHLKIHIKTRQ